MEDVRLLCRAVIRAFYTDEHAAVMEPLLSEPYVLRDDQDTFGSLYLGMGGLHALKTRQVLGELIEHQLIQRWESQEEIEKGKSVTYYYVNFVHFVKTVHIRLYQMEKKMKEDSSERSNANTPAFKCPKCSRTFTEMQALSCPRASTTGAFVCPDDKTILSDELQNQVVKKKATTELLKRFQAQMLGERDLRDDGIRPLLDRIDASANTIVEIRPPFRKRTADGALKDASGNGGTSSSTTAQGTAKDIYLDESVEKNTAASTIPAFLLRSSVTGQRTEEAIIMEKEKQERETRAKQEATEAQQRQAKEEYWKKQLELDDLRKRTESAAATTSGMATSASESDRGDLTSGRIYVTVAGKRVALEDVTEDDLGIMTAEEYLDYSGKCEDGES